MDPEGLALAEPTRIGSTVERLPCYLRVTTRNGRPLAGVTFAVEQAEGPVPEIAYTTGPDGVARIGLPPGKVALRFFLADGRQQPVSLTIRAEPEQTYDVTIDEM
jgi:hypothetical protein